MDNETRTTTIEEIAGQFRLQGDFVSGAAYGSGHINDTFLLDCNSKGTKVCYILQRINTAVFTEPQKLMENVVRVTKHQYEKLRERNEEEIDRKCLRFIPAHDGKCYSVDALGNFWRVCQYIGRAHTCDVVKSGSQTFEVAASFARFQKQLVGLPGGRLHETIPDFHNTVRRFEALETAVRTDAHGRVSACEQEIAFAMARKKITSSLLSLMEQGVIPERITHNDAKLNNIMLDDKTGRGICIIDLDTVMPGSSLYDFGDMVRTSTCTAAEDEKELDTVEIDTRLFEALAEGYLSEAREFLTTAEIDHLVFSGKLITFEQGTRFLTDCLNGDRYYKTRYPDHNLDRAKNQFALVASIEEKEGTLNALVKKLDGKKL